MTIWIGIAVYKVSGIIDESLTRRTSNETIASRMDQIPLDTNRFLEQETLHSLLSTGWL
jgi:hypothetical protein